MTNKKRKKISVATDKGKKNSTYTKLQATILSLGLGLGTIGGGAYVWHNTDRAQTQTPKATQQSTANGAFAPDDTKMPVQITPQIVDEIQSK